MTKRPYDAYNFLYALEKKPSVGIKETGKMVV